MKKVCALGALLSAFAALPAVAQGDGVGNPSGSLEARLLATEQRLADAEAEIARLRGGSSDAMFERDQDRDAELDAAIERALEAKLERSFYGGKLTKSGKPIRFYGFMRLDAYYNTARANSVFTPAFVLPENNVSADKNDDEFAFDPRLTRLGVDVDGGEIGGAAVTGKLEIDFANFTGGAESRPTPRIRHAWINIDYGSFFMQFGQNWDVISPLYPSVNAELLMWNAGNLGDRRAQARFGFNGGDADDVAFSFVGALAFSDAVGNRDLDAAAPPFTSTTRDGWDSGVPMLQGRAALSVGGAEFGLWGHVASYETDTNFGNGKHFRGQSLGVDLNLDLGPVTLIGEGWIGQALRDMRGGIGQDVNLTNGREIDSMGGWAEVRFRVSDFLGMSFGGSIDNPENGDVMAGGALKNFTLYVGTTHNWGGGLKSGFDVIYWETDWKRSMTNPGGVGNMMRFNAYTQLNF